MSGPSAESTKFYGPAGTFDGVESALPTVRETFSRCSPNSKRSAIVLDMHGASPLTTAPTVLCTTLDAHETECIRAGISGASALAGVALQLGVGAPEDVKQEAPNTT